MIGSVTIRGGGALALAAAISTKRAVPRWRVAVVQEDCHEDQQPGAADATIATFHDRVGLPHALFQRETRAAPVTAAILSGWGEGDFVVPENARERFAEGVAVHQLWFRREMAGVPSLDSLLQEAAAPPAWRFNRVAYADLLRRMASRIGVEETHTAEGDLVIDCGSSGRCRGDWEDWSARLPTLRAERVPAGGATTGGVERLVRSGDGIEWSSPCVTSRLAPFAGMAGRSRSPWRGKEIAIGPAAIAVPPLFSLPLSAGLTDVLRLTRLLPRNGDSLTLAAEYNRQATRAHEALLDFASAPFALAPGCHGDMSSGLSAVVAQFRRRGRIPLREGDPIGRGRWITLLAGLGIRPDQIDPVARNLNDDIADRLLSAITHPPS